MSITSRLSPSRAVRVLKVFGSFVIDVTQVPPTFPGLNGWPPGRLTVFARIWFWAPALSASASSRESSSFGPHPARTADSRARASSPPAPLSRGCDRSCISPSLKTPARRLRRAGAAARARFWLLIYQKPPKVAGRDRNESGSRICAETCRGLVERRGRRPRRPPRHRPSAGRPRLRRAGHRRPAPLLHRPAAGARKAALAARVDLVRRRSLSRRVPGVGAARGDPEQVSRSAEQVPDKAHGLVRPDHRRLGGEAGPAPRSRQRVVRAPAGGCSRPASNGPRASGSPALSGSRTSTARRRSWRGCGAPSGWPSISTTTPARSSLRCRRSTSRGGRPGGSSSAICHRLGGWFFWMRIWSDRPAVDLQSDVSCLVSRELFDEYFLPFIEQQTAWAERTVYHLDGPGAIRHLDSLLALPRLTAIQWVPGAGAPGALALDPAGEADPGGGQAPFSRLRAWRGRNPGARAASRGVDALDAMRQRGGGPRPAREPARLDEALTRRGCARIHAANLLLDRWRNP